MVHTMSGFPAIGTRFFRGMPLDPPRAGMTASVGITAPSSPHRCLIPPRPLTAAATASAGEALVRVGAGVGSVPQRLSR